MFYWVFGLRKSVAKTHYFAGTFVTVGSGVMNIGYARVSTLDQNLDLHPTARRYKVDCTSMGTYATRVP